MPFEIEHLLARVLAMESGASLLLYCVEGFEMLDRDAFVLV